MGSNPESLEIVFFVLADLNIILLIAVIVSGGLYLYTNFFTDNGNSKSKKYFWWLLGIFTLTVTANVIVVIYAAQSAVGSCGGKPPYSGGFDQIK